MSFLPLVAPRRGRIHSHLHLHLIGCNGGWHSAHFPSRNHWPSAYVLFCLFVLGGIDWMLLAGSVSWAMHPISRRRGSHKRTHASICIC